MQNNSAKCRNCKTEKPNDQFNKSARNKNGLQAWCQSCQRSDMAERDKANPERNNNRRRVRAEYIRTRNDGTLTSKQVKLYRASVTTCT